MTADKLTSKQLRFVLLVVEGETQSKAYQLAGYAANTPKVIEANASRLASSAKVRDEIARLQALARNRAVITVESLTDDLIDIRTKAMAAGSYGPAVQAVLIIAKLNGLMIEKSETTVLHRPAPLPTKILELSEQDWVRQFGQGLQEKRLQKLETIVRKK